MASRLPVLRAEIIDDSAFAKKLTWTVAPHEVESVGREPRSFPPTVLYSLSTPASYKSDFPLVKPQSEPDLTADKCISPSAVFTNLVPPCSIPLPPSSSFSSQSSLASSSSSSSSSALSDQLTVTDKFLDMAEDKAVLPPEFRGKPGDNGEDWFRHFEHYCDYKELSAEKKLALFKLLMTDLAGDWLASLPPAAVATFDVESDNMPKLEFLL